MRLLLVSTIVGQILRLFSLAFLPPALLALIDQDAVSLLGFATAGGLSWGIGTLAHARFVRPRIFYRAEALAVVAGTWLTISVVGAIPYLFEGLSIIDALFESMSGLTTTGATIFTHFDHPRSLFLWRSMTQWVGGLGVIALFVVVLPRLGIAGRQLFFTEASSAPGEAVSPQVRQAARYLWVLYTLMTVLCAALLLLAGLPLFDAICNSMTTLAAGGFSPSGTSIMGYQNPTAEWILVLFMFLAGASYPLQLKVYTGQLAGFFRDGEFLFYLAINALCIGGLAVILELAGSAPQDALRMAAFQITSLGSSTGFASVDYNLWADNAKALLVLIMLIGGCAGSAAGGPKCVRYLLLGRHILREFKQTLHPRAVLPLLYKGAPVPNAIMRAVVTLVGLYITGYLLVGLLLSIFEADMITSFSAALACLGNIGPGFNVVGPMGNYASFSTAGKSILFVAMWVGRLEILSLLALLHPHVWKNLSLLRR